MIALSPSLSIKPPTIYSVCNLRCVSVTQVLKWLGTDVMPDCGNTGVPPSFRPIVIWFFTYDTTPPQGSSTYCAPAISLWDVEVQVDIITRNLTSVRELRPFNSSTSPFSSLSSNITGLPLNGRAYNGVAFNLTNADQFVNERARAVTLQLPSSILESAEISPGGLNNAFSTNSFVGMATQVYVGFAFESPKFRLHWQHLTVCRQCIWSS